MRIRALASILCAAAVLPACVRAHPTIAAEPPAGPQIPEFKITRLSSSPTPLRIEVQSGSVEALIPDGWEARPLPDSRFPQQGLVASPSLDDWERGVGGVGGLEAFWVDIGTARVPSDWYYYVAQGPAVAAIASDSHCHRSTQEVWANHPPDPSGRRLSPSDYVVSATGVCRSDEGEATHWAYAVVAPGFGPTREVGIPTSGLYVVVAMMSGPGTRPLLDELIDAARFGNTPITQILAAARTTPS
jgi:hypothetical protein